MTCCEHECRLQEQALLKCLLGGRVLGDGLGTLRHGVLGQLTGEQEADSRLDLAAGDGRLAVVLGQARGLAGNALEQVVDKRVHDAHGLGADADIRVHLLQHLVDVDAVALLALLAAATGAGRGLAGLLLSLLAGLGWHGCVCWL